MDAVSRGPYDGRSDRSHETEDLSDIPKVFLSNDVRRRNNPLPEIHRAVAESRRQGRRPITTREKRDLALLSIETRRETFVTVCRGGHDTSSGGAPPVQGRRQDRNLFWTGPPPKSMAEAGFRRVFSNRAQCCYCEVTIRLWSAEDDPWVRHKHYSPCCRRLLQVGDEGIHPTALGKKRLRLSCSSLYDLVRPNA